MLNLWELTQEARDRAIDKGSVVTDAKAQIIASLLVKDIIVRTGGFWLYDEYTFTTAASTGAYAFPSRFMKPLSLMNTSNNREVPQAHFRIERADIDRSQTGLPDCYSFTQLRDVQNQPSSASVVTVVSASASDTAANGHYLRLRGLDSNSIEVRETLSMNGASNVLSSTSFSELWTVEKVTSNTIANDDNNRYFSNGIYTVTSNSAVVTLVKLGVDEERRSFQWFRLFPTPDAADSYRLHFLRRPAEVSHKYDKLDLPDFLEGAALFYLEWYIKYYLLDQRDEKTFQLYLEQLNQATEFLKRNEDERIIHGEIDPTQGSRLYQPPVGYISRRA